MLSTPPPHVFVIRLSMEGMRLKIPVVPVCFVMSLFLPSQSAAFGSRIYVGEFSTESLTSHNFICLHPTVINELTSTPLHPTPFFLSFNPHHKTPQKSSMTGVPFLSLQGALELNPQVDPLHNEPLVQMWLEIKIKPLLKSITKGFLSCLSTKRFSCSTYQTV